MTITHKVMKFKILKSSVSSVSEEFEYHSSYKDFRLARAELRDNKMKLDSLILQIILINTQKPARNMLKF